MHKFAECGLQPTLSHLVAQVHLYHTPCLVSRIMKVNAQDKFQWSRGLDMRYLLVNKLSDGPFLRKIIFIKYEQWCMGLGMF